MKKYIFIVIFIVSYGICFGQIGIGIQGGLFSTTNWTGTFNGQNAVYYINRANHTGQQTSTTISDFTSAVESAAPVKGFSNNVAGDGITQNNLNGIWSFGLSLSINDNVQFIFNQTGATLNIASAGINISAPESIMIHRNGDYIPFRTPANNTNPTLTQYWYLNGSNFVIVCSPTAVSTDIFEVRQFEIGKF